MTNEDCGAYEIELPKDFDILKFLSDVKGESKKFWLIHFYDGIHRFSGVMFPEDIEKQWVRIMLDIDNASGVAYVNAGWKQSLTKLEIAKEVMSVLKGTKLYKDGVEIK